MVQPVNPTEEQIEVIPSSLSPRTNIRTQPQMIRSNSSSGVTTFHATHPPSSPTSSKLSRNRNVIKNNTGDLRSSLRSFKVSQNSTFRGGSPSRSLQPTLADLEFPPPPDLPPPPEEFDSVSFDQIDCSVALMTSSQELKKKVSALAVTKKLTTRESESVESSDISTLQPSVEEASSRFGVSLKKREPYADTFAIKDCKEERKEKSPQCMSLTLTSPSHDGKSPMSIDSDVPVLGSPLDHFPPLPLHLENGEFHLKLF